MSNYTRGPDFGSKIKVLEVAGFRMAETLYAPHQEIPPDATTWPDLCLALAGGYEERLGQTWLQCESASLVFHPAGNVHSDRISDRGSRCLTVQIDPSLLRSATPVAVSPDSFTVPRRGLPTQLAFELAVEFEIQDDLSAVALESAVLALLGELASLPGLELRDTAPPWLERAREEVHHEFARRLSLETLARTAGVHRAPRPGVSEPLRLHRGKLHSATSARVRLPRARRDASAAERYRPVRRLRRSEPLHRHIPASHRDDARRVPVTVCATLSTIRVTPLQDGRGSHQ